MSGLEEHAHIEREGVKLQELHSIEQDL